MATIADQRFAGIEQEIETTTKKIESILNALDKNAVSDLIDAILASPRIFFLGKGRSGLMAGATAMRFVQLGFTTFVIGETTTPAVQENDLVIVISSSGETNEIVYHIRIVLDIGAKIVALTSAETSTIAKLADIVIKLPKRNNDEAKLDYAERRIRGAPIAPLGTLPEVATLIIFDSIVSVLMEETKQTEEDMGKRHSL